MSDDLSRQLEKILNEYSNTKVFPATQEALKESALETAELLRRSSPVGKSSNRFIDNWTVVPYKNVVYVGNSKLAANNIPLINIVNSQSRLVDSVWGQNQKSIQAKTIQRLKSKIK